MYYEFTIIYTNGKVSICNLEPFELNDQLAFCREGKRGKWIKDYSYEAIREEY